MSKKRLQKGRKTKNFLIILFILYLSLSVLPLRTGGGQAGHIPDLIGSQAVLFLMCLVIWYLLVGILKYERVPYTWLKIVACILTAGALSVAFYYLSPWGAFPFNPVTDKISVQSFAAIFGRGLFIAVIYLPLAFLIQQSRKLQQKEKEVDRLKQIHLQTRIESLQSKLSPHFLFNALNVLKSGTEDKWVREYTVALSTTYRYLIDHKINEALIPIQSELHFIDAYLYLLKARFGKGINIHITDSIRHATGKIPPLTLQLLLENAVKHNIISTKDPLNIDIMLEDNRITVRNKIAKKKIPDFTSNGIGLYSIREQYRLISGKNISIGNDGRYFTVKVPVLSQNNLLENVDP